MVDLHCHILPGIDDGPDKIEDSLAMAEDAIADGITHVVATPHASDDHWFDFSRVRLLRDQLQARLRDRLALATGCDFHLNPENLTALREDASRFCINQHDYLLVEFNEFSIPPAMDKTLHELQLLGLRPIITHPERNGILRAQTPRLKRWVSLGYYIQVTANALTGTFGAGSQKDAMRWIADGLVHFVSSDAHNTKTRPLRLRPAYDVVANEFGVEKAEALFHDNPLAAWEGRELPHVPDPDTEPLVARRKRFFFF
jgi:protein-tyrosine phosphatase